MAKSRIAIYGAITANAAIAVPALGIAGITACHPFVGGAYRRDRGQCRQGRDLQQCGANVEAPPLLAKLATEGRR